MSTMKNDGEILQKPSGGTYYIHQKERRKIDRRRNDGRRVIKKTATIKITFPNPTWIRLLLLANPMDF